MRTAKVRSLERRVWGSSPMQKKLKSECQIMVTVTQTPIAGSLHNIVGTYWGKDRSTLNKMA